MVIDMRIGNKKYTLSKFSYLIIGITSTVIIALLIYLIFFRVPKSDKVVSYLKCNSHYTESVVDSDVTKNIVIGLNYRDKMVTNTITEIYYFKNKDDYKQMVELSDSEKINSSDKTTYSFDDINMTITLVIELKKSSSAFQSLPKDKKSLLKYYENEKMTCS